jgi:hypothetical protein
MQALAQAVFSAPPGPEFFWVEGPELDAQQIEHQVGELQRPLRLLAVWGGVAGNFLRLWVRVLD